jgi:hypothetical protein
MIILKNMTKQAIRPSSNTEKRLYPWCPAQGLMTERGESISMISRHLHLIEIKIDLFVRDKDSIFI